jgi:hypothetical protein
MGLHGVLSACALTFGGLLLLGVRAADLLGCRRIFMAGAVFSTAANQKEERTMTIYGYLMKAVQDDARRAGERDRLLLEARRARGARRQRLVPAAPARRRTETGKIVVRETSHSTESSKTRPATKAAGPAAGSA